MTYDASDRKSIRKAEKLAKQAEAKRRVFIRHLLATIDGREWMHDLLTRCHIFHTPFAAGKPDVTAFRCGEQNLGLQLFADVVSAAPDQYTLMMYEASQKEALDDRRDSDNRSPDAPADGTGTEQDSGRDDQGSGDYDPFDSSLH